MQQAGFLKNGLRGNHAIKIASHIQAQRELHLGLDAWKSSQRCSVLKNKHVSIIFMGLCTSAFATHDEDEPMSARWW